MKIIHNRIRCKSCGDIIESVFGHDFRYCSCRAVAVDGGRSYLRRVGELNKIEERSVVEYENLPGLGIDFPLDYWLCRYLEQWLQAQEEEKVALLPQIQQAAQTQLSQGRMNKGQYGYLLAQLEK